MHAEELVCSMELLQQYKKRLPLASIHEKPSMILGCPGCAAELTKIMLSQALPLGQIFLNHSLILPNIRVKVTCSKTHAEGVCLQHRASAARPTKVMSGQPFPLSQVLLYHSLGGNASVVCPGQPQHVVATHAPPAHHSVLNGVGEGVAQVQGACHVGGWDHNDKGGLVAVQLRFEEAGLLPPLVPASSTKLFSIPKRLTYFRSVIPTLEIYNQKRLGTVKMRFYCPQMFLIHKSSSGYNNITVCD